MESINETVYNAEEITIDFSEGFEEYSKECDTYNDFEDLKDYYEPLPLLEQDTVVYPVQLEEEDVYEDEFVVVGRVKRRPQKTKKSFKWAKKPKQSFCNAVINGEACKNKDKCQQYHTFEEVRTCSVVKCDRVEFVNNFYTGTCNNKHLNETGANYVTRLQIKRSPIAKNFKFMFFERPSTEFARQLLEASKTVGAKTVEFGFTKPTQTLDSFLKN